MVDLRPGEPKTLALLLDYMNLTGAGYEVLIRDSFAARCEELGLNLLLLYGRRWGDPHPAAKAHNSIYDLALSDRVDGIIVLSTSLVADSSQLHEFLDRFRSKPLCSVGTAISGVPSVVIEGADALAQVVEHLIVEHGRRELAFVCGPQDNSDSRARERVFSEVLERHGLQTHPGRILPGDFLTSGGVKAAERLIASGVPFDAIVAANDGMALGVIDTLRRHGIRVPADVAVTGFDDLSSAGQGNPPLTTVAQPFAEIARRAIDVVLQQIDGQEVPATLTLVGSKVIRRSCGCGSRVAAQKTLAGMDLEQLVGASSIAEHPALRAAIEDSLELAYSKSPDPDGASLGCRVATRLLDGLLEELTGAGSFLAALETALAAAPENLEVGLALRDMVNLLREAFRHRAPRQLEDLWHDASEMIALAEVTSQTQRRMHQDRLNERFLGISERLSLALDLDSLGRALKDALPPLGLGTAAISSYKSPSSNDLVPLVCLLDGQSVAASSSSFADLELWPEGFLPESRRSTALVFPLVFESQRLGVGIFEYVDHLVAYPMVRDQISAAMRSVALKEEVLAKTRLHERSVQERLATKKRLQALSVLAGGVAHDLNNTLGPLVGLPDLLLGQLRSLGLEPAPLETITADLAAIKSAAQRTSQTVKNLLTLGREGRTPKANVDLSDVIARCLDSDSMRLLKETNTSTRVEFQRSRQTLIVSAAESQLERAITNLVRNAMEATQERGDIQVRTWFEQRVRTREGYEAVPPGQYAVMSVSDHGAGIDEADLHRVFEPFFSKKETRERSGTGLGLAIVHSVVKEHGGYVDVDSMPGKGTTFTLYLPKAPGRASVVPDSSDTPVGQARILIVDDEPMQLRTASRLLSHLGYHVETAADPQQALDKFLRSIKAESPYDLVIVDVILGDDGDGLELFEQMLAFAPLQRALLVSGHAPVDRMELAQAKGWPWLPKPYSIESLAQAVQTALPSGPKSGA